MNMSEPEGTDSQRYDAENSMKKFRDYEEARKREPELLKNIKARLSELEELLRETEGHWQLEDGFYRFYHQSFKVYHLQSITETLVKTFESLLPGRPLNEWFIQIVREGTGKKFEPEHNKAWLQITRPILEAIFHAHYFLVLICKYGRELESPPNPLPSGWGTVLYLYEIR